MCPLLFLCVVIFMLYDGITISRSIKYYTIRNRQQNVYHESTVFSSWVDTKEDLENFLSCVSPSAEHRDFRYTQP